MTASTLYSVDTSALLDGLERYYFEDAFPGIWERVGELVGTGRFFISEEVYEEAKKKTGVVKAWCDRDITGNLIIPTDGTVTREVRAILKDFPRMVGTLKGRNRADPFVVALGRLKHATVVTGERDDGNERHPKIPFVCDRLGIPCMKFTDLIRAEGWRFRAD